MNQFSPADFLPDLNQYPTISRTDIDQFIVIVDELAGYPLHKMDEGLHFALEQTARLVNAENAFWLATTYNPTDDNPFNKVFQGWMPRQVISLVEDEERQKLLDLILRRFRGADEDEYVALNSAGVGSSRASMRSDSEQMQTDAVKWMEKEVFAKGLLADRVTAACPVTTDSESFMGFDRIDNKQAFNEREKELIRVISFGMKWFFTHLHRSYGYIDAKEALTKRERQVLMLLLTDMSEKQMADTLNLSKKTTHHHVSRIYNKYSVRSRAGLMAMWLNYSADK
ncbi:MAG: helix-turn-helix transcriptional regulator [Pseudomonadales bacterium]|nr:helix-turn-helix transcriptional regulator [Pseudomonadales bacterium]